MSCKRRSSEARALEVTVGSAGDFFDLKERPGVLGELTAVETDEAVDHAVRREDGDPGRVHVDKGHHHRGFRKRRLRQTVGLALHLGLRADTQLGRARSCMYATEVS